MISSERAVRSLPNPACAEPLATPAFEPGLFLRAALSTGQTYVDVGANNGVATCLQAAQAVGPTGRVVALEPNPARYARLLHNVALNRAANTQCFPVAASDETIHATLFCEFPRGAAAAGRSIRVQRVDSLCLKLGLNEVDLVKIDAPLSELLVLRGMGRLLASQSPPRILCLGSKWPAESLVGHRDTLVTYMAMHGYGARQLGPTAITREPGSTALGRVALWFTKALHAAGPRVDFSLPLTRS